MVAGEKTFEYREIKHWMDSRLFNKDGTARIIDLVNFRLGYAVTLPYLICKILSVTKISQVHEVYIGSK